MVKQMQFDEKTATASGRDQRWEAVKQLRGQSSPWKQPGNHMETAVQSNHGREVTWSNHSRTWVDTIMCKSASMNANNEYGKDASWHRICSSLAEPFFQQDIYIWAACFPHEQCNMDSKCLSQYQPLALLKLPLIFDQKKRAAVMELEGKTYRNPL